jgi:hypothetical protein
VFATRAVFHEPMMTLKAVALLNMFPRAPRLRVPSADTGWNRCRIADRVSAIDHATPVSDAVCGGFCIGSSPAFKSTVWQHLRRRRFFYQPFRV